MGPSLVVIYRRSFWRRNFVITIRYYSLFVIFKYINKVITGSSMHNAQHSRDNLCFPHNNNNHHHYRYYVLLLLTTKKTTLNNSRNYYSKSINRSINSISNNKNYRRSDQKMFQVAFLLDQAVKIRPENLGKTLLEGITQEIEDLYVDKVLRNLGLVVTLYEVCSITGGILHQGNEGAANYEVQFKVVLFSPFVGEILEGKVIGSTDEFGIRISLGFFHDLIVLPNREGMDLERTKWDITETTQDGMWFITKDVVAGDDDKGDNQHQTKNETTKTTTTGVDYDDDEEGNDSNNNNNNNNTKKEIFSIEAGQKIRVRVQAVQFPEEPKSKKELELRKLEDGGEREGLFAPMVVKCSIKENALGPFFDEDWTNGD